MCIRHRCLMWSLTSGRYCWPGIRVWKVWWLTAFLLSLSFSRPCLVFYVSQLTRCEISHLFQRSFSDIKLGLSTGGSMIHSPQFCFSQSLQIAVNTDFFFPPPFWTAHTLLGCHPYPVSIWNDSRVKSLNAGSSHPSPPPTPEYPPHVSNTFELRLLSLTECSTPASYPTFSPCRSEIHGNQDNEHLTYFDSSVHIGCQSRWTARSFTASSVKRRTQSNTTNCSWKCLTRMGRSTKHRWHSSGQTVKTGEKRAEGRKMHKERPTK